MNIIIDNFTEWKNVSEEEPDETDISMHKYDLPFGYAEMIAFKVFSKSLNSKTALKQCRLKDYIGMYASELIYSTSDQIRELYLSE